MEDGFISTGEFVPGPIRYAASTFSLTTDRAVSIVAPYWRLTEYTILSGSVWSRVTRDEDTLDITASLISGSNPDFANFQPQQVVVVTWDSVGIEYYGIVSSECAHGLSLVTLKYVLKFIGWSFPYS